MSRYLLSGRQIDMRHRFGTRAYAACQDLRVVQELMGHASPVSTAGYVAYSQADAVAAVSAAAHLGNAEIAPARLPE